MADIAMCSNTKCPLRSTCYRALATPGEWQSYANFQFVEGIGCSYYWDVGHMRKK